MQRSHQGEQQRPRGQFGQPLAALNGSNEQRRPAFGFFGIKVADNRDMVIPFFDKMRDLPRAERAQHGFGKTDQLPLLLLVSVGATRGQNPAPGEIVNKTFYGLLDLKPSILRIRHFIQTVQQDQSSFFLKDLVQIRCELFQVLPKFGFDELPEGIAAGRLTGFRQTASSQVAQDDPDRQQRTMVPGLTLLLRAFTLLFLVFFCRHRGCHDGNVG